MLCVCEVHVYAHASACACVCVCSACVKIDMQLSWLCVCGVCVRVCHRGERVCVLCATDLSMSGMLDGISPQQRRRVGRTSLSGSHRVHRSTAGRNVH